MLTGPLRISTAMVACYAVPAESGVVLVDTGLPGRTERILSALAEHGLRAGDIRLIVVTHAHGDHIGNLAEIARLSGAPVLAHAAEAAALASGKRVPVQGITPLGKVASAAINLAPAIRGLDAEPHVAEIQITAERSLADFGLAGRVLPTPGHTEGSLSLVLDSGEAFVGDLCSRYLPRRSFLPPLGVDKDAVVAGWRTVLTAGATTIYPAHGREFPADRLWTELERVEYGDDGCGFGRLAALAAVGATGVLLARRWRGRGRRG